ncbi:MAG TPA: putative lipid II flippase FtsW [Roseimicrobium sp.]|nr:putative lipid II flippase FtsW [Roseimicrobium sp.]
MRWATTVLVTCVAALLALSMVMLYSAGMAQKGAHYLLMQMVWCLLGLVACVAGASLDYRWLKKTSWPLLGIAIVLLVLVMIIGMKINGARRWFNFGGIRFQPSELGKIALIIALAAYIDRFHRLIPTFRGGVIIPGLIIGSIVGLIFIEPDRGNAILMSAVTGAMLLIAGLRWRYFLPPLILGLVFLSFSLWHDPVRRERILAFLSPEEHKQGVGYQAWQGTLALGSGGWTGLGLGNGRQKMGFVPEHHTDFILSVIGEELGLVATLSVVVAFICIILCGAYIAWHAKDLFGQMLATGITFLIGIQAFINIGVVTGALPNKGISLPFVSYGGSNLLMMLASIGLLLSVARHAVETAPARESVSEPVDIRVTQLS